ncbi:MAG TPA: hypothetical protein DDY20_06385 [Desulfobulbaceae bacterium]|nr:hypothetical protein [Desulfobulbaceae bacterium]
MSRGSSGAKTSAGSVIRARILASMGAVLVLITFLAGFCLYTIITLPKADMRPDRLPAPPAAKTVQATENLAALLLEARTIEQQFHQQQTPAGATQFEEVSKNLLVQALELEKNAKQSNDPKASQAAQIVQLVSQYNTSFRDLVQAFEAKGTREDAGPGPESKKSVRKIPLAAGQAGKTQGLEESLMQLGRAEQKYFTARTPDNQRLLADAAKALATAAGESSLETSGLQAINKSITNYTTAFDRYQAVSLATPDPTLSAAFAAEQTRQKEIMHKAALEMEKLISGLSPARDATSDPAPAVQNKNIEELTAGVNKSFSALQAGINAMSAKAAPPAPKKGPAFGLPLQVSLMIIAGTWLAIVLLSLLLARMLSGSLTSPIQRMTDIAHRMAAKGDFSLAFPQEKNEFGGLATALNIMVRQQAVNASGNEAAASELATKTSHMAQLIQDKADHDARVAAVVDEQANMLARIRTAVDKMNADARLLRQNTDGLSGHGQAVQQAAAGCEQTVGAADETVQAIVQSAGQMASVITAFTELAEQTSVVALNAAIKAIRAGSQGKEFGAVTEELDRLAKRSTETARDITHLLNAMTSRIAAGEKLGNESRDALQRLTATSSTSLQALGEIDRAAGALQKSSADTAALLAELVAISGQADSLVRALGPLNKTAADALASLGSASGTTAGANLEDMVKKMMQDDPGDETGTALPAGETGQADRS